MAQISVDFHYIIIVLVSNLNCKFLHKNADYLVSHISPTRLLKLTSISQEGSEPLTTSLAVNLNETDQPTKNQKWKRKYSP